MADSPKKTKEIARKLGRGLTGPVVITLNGELGAGKTCFAGGLAEGLGVEGIVTSPTFSLLNIYKGRQFEVCHFDMYRVRGFFDLESTGFFDFLGRAVMIVEWSSNIAEFLPKERIDVEIKKLGEFAREILILGL